jgi:acetylornithine deacetylase/succinyl-diaminopimelate desuccinylase-like protein
VVKVSLRPKAAFLEIRHPKNQQQGRVRLLKTATIFLLLSLGAGGAALAAQQAQDEIAFRDLYKELVEINTTLSAGDCTRAAWAMAARLKAAGIAPADIHLIVPDKMPKLGNLVVVLHGKDKTRKALLLLAHLDVVEARREDWVRDPFTLIEEGGFFYGRGSADDKAMAAIFVDAVMRFKKEGYQPQRTIKLALTCGEETPDNFDGAKYLVENHRDLIDAAFAINEGGGGQLDGKGRRIFNGVLAGEKVYQDYRLEITNPGGHSSRPVKDNAIYRLAAGLSRLSRFEFPVEFNGATRKFFERMATIETGQLASDMRAILGTPADPEALKRIVADPGYNAMLRTTCVATMINGGHAPNGLPQRAGANVNCRILSTHTQEEIRQTLERVVADSGIRITFVAPPEKVSSAPPLTPAILGPIERLTQKMWPGVPVVPIMQAGATDARFLTPAGIPTYGVSGLFADPATVNAHGLNERMHVQSLYEGRTFLMQLIKAYADE